MDPAWLPAVALAAVLAAAAGTKIAEIEATADGFAALGVPRPTVAARVVPGVELATAVLLLVAPRVGALAALVLLVGFSGFLAARMWTHPGTPCRCFGSTRSRPVGRTDLLRNGLLAAVAALVLVRPPG